MLSLEVTKKMNKRLLISTLTICVIIILGSIYSNFNTKEDVSDDNLLESYKYDYILAPNIMDTNTEGGRYISNPIYRVNSAQQPQSSRQNQQGVLIQNRYICQ